MSRVRAYRRIGAIDGIEVHKPPVGREVIEDVPDIGELITRGSLESYEGRLQADLEAIGLEEQHVFVARGEDGRVQGILVGFFLGWAAYGRPELEDIYGGLLIDTLSTHAYIDAIEVYEKRQGVGRRLFQAFEKWAKEHGAEGIAGSPMSLEARAFHSSMGLSPHPDDYKLWVKWIE